jgi:hypothetical protein
VLTATAPHDRRVIALLDVARQLLLDVLRFAAVATAARADRRR